MFFKRKKRKSVAAVSVAPAEVKDIGYPIAPTNSEYVACIDKCKGEIEEEMQAYFVAAHNLKVSAKKISRIRGVYSSKLSKRKKTKHAVHIRNYNDSLNAYANIASRLAWLLDTYASCVDGACATAKNSRASTRLRKEAQEYSARILAKKKRIEDITDGIVMPVSTYVK